MVHDPEESMPTEGERRCEFMCHIYKSEAPGSFDQIKVMFEVPVHLNIACVKSEQVFWSLQNSWKQLPAK